MSNSNIKLIKTRGTKNDQTDINQFLTEKLNENLNISFKLLHSECVQKFGPHRLKYDTGRRRISRAKQKIAEGINIVNGNYKRTMPKVVTNEKVNKLVAMIQKDDETSWNVKAFHIKIPYRSASWKNAKRKALHIIQNGNK